jgi:hypothetical protein
MQIIRARRAGDGGYATHQNDLTQKPPSTQNHAETNGESLLFTVIFSGLLRIQRFLR